MSKSFHFRSILTVPWIELGGTVTITCPQTGYHADIDFLTKPFYGGKRNKIQGEVGVIKRFDSISFSCMQWEANNSKVVLFAKMVL